ncbi:MAG: phosphoglycerate kinase [bacterium]
MKKLAIDDLQLQNRRVLMRVDFNVPLDGGRVADDTRIRAALPSIKKVIEKQGKLILMSHFGRPKGQCNEKFTLRPAAKRLGELLGKDVPLAPDCIGSDAAKLIENLNSGDVLLLENVRFHPGEEANDFAFAKELAAFGDVYVNDAFGAAHRSHASTTGVTKFIDHCAAGYLMAAELQALGNLLGEPARPFIAILGGAKISGKIDVIQNLLPRVDTILVGGGMVYTFLRALEIETGKSLVEEDRILVAKEVLDFIDSPQNERKTKLMLPIDHIIADSIDANSGKETDTIVVDRLGVDIGSQTTRSFMNSILSAKTIFWNGPMGVFENSAFAKGTMAIADAVAKATESGAFSVVGGGDSVSALMQSGLAEKISHISTGGGASLEFMSGKELPGVSVLTDT